MECTKPDCDCIAIAEWENNGEHVKSYPCMAGVSLKEYVNTMQIAETGHDLDTTEGCRAYLKGEGFDVDEMAADAVAKMEEIRKKLSNNNGSIL